MAEFGTTKQWKTLSLDEAMEQYMLSPRDLAGLPCVSRYHVCLLYTSPSPRDP